MSEEEFFDAGKRRFAAVHADVTKPVDLSAVTLQSDKARERARQREAIEAKERQMQLEKQKLEEEEEQERKRELEEEQERDAEAKRKLLAQAKERAEAAERKRQQEHDAKRRADEQAAELEAKRKAVELVLDQDEDDEEEARLAAELMKAKKAEKKAKAAELEAAERKAAEKKAAEQKAAEEEAAEKEAAEQKAVEKKAAEKKAAEQEAAEKKAAEKKAAEKKAAEKKAAEQEAAEQKAAEKKAAEQKAAAEKASKKTKARKHDSDDDGDASEEKQKKKKMALPADDKDRAILADIAKSASPETAWFGGALLTAVAQIMMKSLSEGSRKAKPTTEKIAVACAADAQSHKLMAMAIVELVAHQGIEVEAVEGDRLKNRDVADLLLQAAQAEKQCTEKRRAQRLDLLKATRSTLKEALPLSALIAAGGIGAARFATHDSKVLSTALVEAGVAHAAAWKFLGDQKVMRVALDDATLAATPSRTKTRMSILSCASWAVVKAAEKRAAPSSADEDAEKARLAAELKETKKRYEALEKSAEVQQRQLEVEKKRAKAMADIPMVDLSVAPRVAEVEERLPELHGDFHRIAATTAGAFKWDVHKLVRQFGNDLIVVPNHALFELLALRRVAANSTEKTHKYLVAQKHRVCLEEVHGVDSSSDLVPPLVTMISFLRTHARDSDPQHAKSTHRILLSGAAALADYYVSAKWAMDKTSKEEKDKDTLLKQHEMELAHVLFGFLRLDARLTDREGDAAVLQNAVLVDRVTGKPTGEKVVLLADELPHGTAFFFSPALRKVMSMMWERYCEFIGYDIESGDCGAFLAARKLALKKLGTGLADYASRKKHTEEETNAYCVAMLPLMQTFFPDALLGIGQ
jgi:hypothetical protein